MSSLEKKNDEFSGIDNSAKALIELETPYRATVSIIGVSKLLMHNWTNGDKQESAKAPKGTKQFDVVENYVYRNEAGNVCMPTFNFCASLRMAGKSFSDPASPRKSLHDRVKAAIVPDEEYAVFNGNAKTWDFIDTRRVVVQRAGISRSRPGFYEGWKLTFKILVTDPMYINELTLRQLVDRAGKFHGIGDFRPTFGRFHVDGIKIESV